MKIKVCGLRDGDNISQVAQLGIDWIGMVFNEQSPHNVTMIPSRAGIIPDRANIKPQSSDLKSKRVGVFVDEMAQNIITRVVNFRLDAIQLQGHEPPTLLRNLRATLTTHSEQGPAIAPHLQIWKTISIGSADDLALWREYEDCVDVFVFNTDNCLDEGQTQHFDWSLLKAYDGPLPFLLSGGIGPEDAEAINQFCHPKFLGIDLGTRFETETAVKDVERLQTFIQRLKPGAGITSNGEAEPCVCS